MISSGTCSACTSWRTLASLLLALGVLLAACNRDSPNDELSTPGAPDASETVEQSDSAIEGMSEPVTPPANDTAADLNEKLPELPATSTADGAPVPGTTEPPASTDSATQP